MKNLFIIVFFISINLKAMEEKPGTLALWFSEDNEHLIPHFRDPDIKGAQKIERYLCYEFQPAIFANPLNFRMIIGQKTAKKIGFKFLKKSDEKWVFKRCPKAKYWYDILQGTKSFNDRLKLIDGIGTSDEFLEALSLGKVLLTNGVSNFKEKIDNNKSFIKAEELSYQYMFHDMNNHMVQIILPEKLRCHLAKIAKHLIKFKEFTKKEKNIDIDDFIDGIVSIIDRNHANISLHISNFFINEHLAFDKKYVLSVFNEISGLFFGYYVDVINMINFLPINNLLLKEICEIICLIEHSSSSFSIKEKNLKSIFLNYVISGVIVSISNNLKKVKSNNHYTIINLAKKFAENFDENDNFSIDISYSLFNQFVDQQRLLGEEIENYFNKGTNHLGQDL